MHEIIVTCDNLVKLYKTADLEVVALQGLDLQVAYGEMIALVGASGSGKTTLMNILGGLDIPSAGTCVVANYNLVHLHEAQRLEYRRHVVGHLWQQSGRNLLPGLTIAANVAVPQVAANTSLQERRRVAHELLDMTNLSTMAHKYPHQLSGGEQQRAGIAVALANRPTLLLADEPTGELDASTSQHIMELFRYFNQHLGLTIILVTHDPAIAATMDRTIAIRDGRTSTETVRRKEPPSAMAKASPTSAVIGLSGVTHREAILVDRVGRLQLPQEMYEKMHFQGHMDIRDCGDHLELWPSDDE